MWLWGWNWRWTNKLGAVSVSLSPGFWNRSNRWSRRLFAARLMLSSSVSQRQGDNKHADFLVSTNRNHQPGFVRVSHIDLVRLSPTIDLTCSFKHKCCCWLFVFCAPGNWQAGGKKIKNQRIPEVLISRSRRCLSRADKQSKHLKAEMMLGIISAEGEHQSSGASGGPIKRSQPHFEALWFCFGKFWVMKSSVQVLIRTLCSPLEMLGD